MKMSSFARLLANTAEAYLNPFPAFHYKKDDQSGRWMAEIKCFRRYYAAVVDTENEAKIWVHDMDAELRNDCKEDEKRWKREGIYEERQRLLDNATRAAERRDFLLETTHMPGCPLNETTHMVGPGPPFKILPCPLSKYGEGGYEFEFTNGDEQC